MNNPEVIPYEVSVLKAQIERLTKEIAVLLDEREDYKTKLVRLLSPFEIGDIIEKEKGYYKGRYIVEDIYFKYGDRIYVSARILRKDGTKGKTLREISADSNSYFGDGFQKVR